jgi:DNA-binding transcriptional ArsR family regulator
VRSLGWRCTWPQPVVIAEGVSSAAVISIFRIITTVLIICCVLIDAAQWLRESGLEVEDLTPLKEKDPGIDAILEVSADSHSARFAVQVKSRAPYPHELDRLQEPWRELAARGHPLIAAPFISEPLGPVLTREGWSWADAQGNFDLRAPGLVFRQRRTSAPPPLKRRSLPRGSGSFAIIRALADFRNEEDEEPGASTLAAQAGVSQPRASQILHQLYDLNLVDRSGRGRWEPRREALLDRFLAEYPGPGGSELYYYSLDSPVDVAARVGRMSTTSRPMLVSADVGPDLILPWRRPSLVIVYEGHVIDPSDLKLTEARGRHDANVILRTPKDRSVFTARALVTQVRGEDVPLADPLQQIWDLQDLGGADRIEAAGRLRQWLLKRP